jgi:hypothetical protein
MRRVWLAAALAALAGAACGKYGPPLRDVPEHTQKTTTPVAAPAAAPTSDAEQCDDPNAPSAAQAKP